MIKTIVDVHNHLELLPSVVNLFNSKIYNHQNSTAFLLNTAREKELKLIISVALYLSPFPGNPLKQIEKQIQKVEEFVMQNNDVKLIKNSQDLDEHFTMGLVLHLESASWLKGNIESLRALHARGVRGIIPVHFVTSWFGGSGEDPRAAYGLTEKGKKFLNEMANLNMWMDISHMDERTCSEALDYFSGNTIASHIGLQKFRPPKRNISEKNARRLFQKNGQYGLIAWSHLMGKTEQDFKEQINFLIDQGFENNLVLGTDFGAPIKTPKFIKSIFDYANFIETNYPDVASKILSENALNFLRSSLPQN